MTGSMFHAVAPVSALCAAFLTQPRRTHRKPENRTLRRRVGVSGRATAQKPERLRAAFGGGEAASGEAGEKTWRFSAPAHPLLPAVRAGLGGKNGAFLRGQKVDWR